MRDTACGILFWTTDKPPVLCKLCICNRVDTRRFAASSRVPRPRRRRRASNDLPEPLRLKGEFSTGACSLLCVGAFFFCSPKCNLSGEDEEKKKEETRPACEPLARERFSLSLSLSLPFFFIYFFCRFFLLRGTRALSQHFPANQVLPTCQPRRDARSFKKKKNTAN